MKILNLSLLIAIIVFVNSLTAQVTGNYDVIKGEQLKLDSRRSGINRMIGSDESGFYILKWEKRRYFIQHLSKNAKLIKETEFSLREGKVEKTIEFFEEMNGKIYLLTSYVNEKKKTNYLFYQTINKETLKPDAKVKKIAEYQFDKRNKIGGYAIQTSDDSTKILIHRYKRQKKNTREELMFLVLNENANVLWSKDITLPYDAELFTTLRYRVGNDGNVYLLNKVWKDKNERSKKSETPNYKLEMLKFHNKGEEMENFEISIGKKLITDINYKITANNDLVCAGFYAVKGSLGIKGSCFFTISGEDGQISKLKTNEFPLEFITQEMTEKEERRHKKKEKKGKSREMLYYDLDRMILRDDGGALLIAEQFRFWITTMRSTDNNGNTTTSYTYHYYYRDIIVININPDGSVAWQTKIPKEQYTRDDGGYASSYQFALINNNKLYFIFNDKPATAYKAARKKGKNTKREYNKVVMYEVDENGTVKNETLFNTKDYGMLTMPKNSKQMDSKNVVLYNEYGKQQQFIRISFD